MQGLTGWFDERKAEEPLCVTSDALAQAGIEQTLATLKRAGMAVVIIDTPPAASTDVAELIGAADLVLAPVIPSPNDLRAIGETLDLIEEQNKPLLFVVNNASTNGKLTNQALTLLSQHGTVAGADGQPIIIRTRQDFRSSMTDGRTVSELKAVKARLEKDARRGRRPAAA
jgi:chromosome partitioning protein